jgi:lipoprotein
MKRIGMFVLSAVLAFAMSGCQVNDNQVDMVEVAEKLVSYSQEVMQKAEEDPSDIASQEQIYQDMEAEFQDVMEEDTLKDVQIKIVTFIMNELSSYSLPVTIQSVSIQEGDSQVLTVKFKDQNQKQGEVILRMQENNGKISYVGVYGK